jgi:diadenosine tetraphosphate (Ap4A) HIT family hydrolase
MSAPPLLPGADPSCPFCAIASEYPPIAPSSTLDSQTSTASDPLNPERMFPPSYVVLSTPGVIAFLDIAPLTRGHILLATRRHLVKTVDLTTAEGAEVCACLSHVSRLRKSAPNPPSSMSAVSRRITLRSLR